eukprot:gene50276-68346_t
MLKKILITTGGLLLITVVLGGIKGLQIGALIAAGANFTLPPEAVTTAQVREETWENTIDVVGSLAAPADALVKGAKAAGNGHVTSVHVATDHGWSDARVRLASEGDHVTKSAAASDGGSLALVVEHDDGTEECLVL